MSLTHHEATRRRHGACRSLGRGPVTGPPCRRAARRGRGEGSTSLETCSVRPSLASYTNRREGRLNQQQGTCRLGMLVRRPHSGSFAITAQSIIRQYSNKTDWLVMMQCVLDGATAIHHLAQNVSGRRCLRGSSRLTKRTFEHCHQLQ